MQVFAIWNEQEYLIEKAKGYAAKYDELATHLLLGSFLSFISKFTMENYYRFLYEPLFCDI